MYAFHLTALLLVGQPFGDTFSKQRNKVGRTKEKAMNVFTLFP